MKISHPQRLVPAGIYQLKVNIKNTRARCEIVYFEHVIAGWGIYYTKRVFRTLSNIYDRTFFVNTWPFSVIGKTFIIDFWLSFKYTCLHSTILELYSTAVLNKFRFGYLMLSLEWYENINI